MATIAKLLIELGMNVDGAAKVEQSIKSIQGEAEKLGSSGVANVDKLNRAFISASDSSGSLAGKLKGAVGSAMSGFTSLVMGVSAALVGAGFAGFKFLESQTKQLDQTNDLAFSLGINVEELQRLEYAAKQSGLETDVLAKGIKGLNVSMLEAQAGGAANFQEALKTIGVSLDKLKGKSQTEQLGIIGDGLNKIKDDAEASALAAELFGKKAGPQMLQLLSEGSRGLKELTAAAQGVLTKEQIEEAARYRDAMDQLDAQVGAFAKTLTIEMLPIAFEIVDAMKSWIHQNRTLIAQKLHEAFDFLANALNIVWDAIKGVSTDIAPLIDALGGMPTILNFITDALTAMAIGLKTITGTFRALLDDMYTFKDLGNDLLDIDRKARERNATPKGFKELVGEKAGEKFHRVTPAKGGPSKPRHHFGDTAKEKEAAKHKKSGVTVNDAIDALLEGRSGVIGQRLRDVASATPKAEEIKPTVAITNFSVVMNITARSTDPTQIGPEIVQAFKAELGRHNARAAQSLGGNVVR